MANICVIDDNDLMRDSVARTLEAADHQVEPFADPTAAVEPLLAGRFDLAVTDLKMPRLDGVALLGKLRAGGCDTPVILMTAFGTVETAVEAMKLGAFDYLTKPFKGDELEIIVERALAHRQLERKNEALRQEVADASAARPIIAESQAMKRVLAQVDRVASTAATVLITGESGTGKELIARAIHAAGPRAAQPMLAVNCAALSPTLLESELFGHEKGAFTGAEKLRRGRFELADGGTLLLDEIGELDDRLQAKLLRVLQEREFERVGSSMPIRVDVRVIATTNRPLADWVHQGRFREDLFYRLSVLPIALPALRDRPDDVLPLARFLLDRIARRDARPAVELTEPAAQLLLTYRWPGNVRELENLMERCSALATGSKVDAAMVGDLLHPGQDGAGPGTCGSGLGQDANQRLAEQEKDEVLRIADLPDGEAMEAMERRLIMATLRRFAGHRARTADALGIGLRTLGLKLKRYREQARESGIGPRASDWSFDNLDFARLTATRSPEGTQGSAFSAGSFCAIGAKTA
jgi:DNA-binding NtrC family response regulator